MVIIAIVDHQNKQNAEQRCITQIKEQLYAYLSQSMLRLLNQSMNAKQNVVCSSLEDKSKMTSTFAIGCCKTQPSGLEWLQMSNWVC